MNEDELWNLMDKIDLSIDDLKEIECSYCKSKQFIKDDSLLTCSECYNIMENVIDCSAEWRYYNGDDSKSEDPSRCGLPTNTLLPKSSLGSIIGKSMRDSKDLHCIRKLQTWTSMPYSERKLLNVFERFTNNTNNMGISGKAIKKISKITTLVALSFLTFSCLDNSVKLKEISSWQVVEGFK